jgi:hypothetical protein
MLRRMFDDLQLYLHAVPPGLPFDLEFAPTSFAADKGEAQEGEGLRFAEPAPLAACRREGEPDMIGKNADRRVLASQRQVVQ